MSEITISSIVQYIIAIALAVSGYILKSYVNRLETRQQNTEDEIKEIEIVIAKLQENRIEEVKMLEKLESKVEEIKEVLYEG